MSLRALAVLGLALAALGWWFSPQSPRQPDAPALAAGEVPHCPPPPQTAPGAAPLQSEVPAGLRPVRLEAATLTPLAGFSVEARVLGRQDYARGREAALSPTDLALGWQRMREDAVLDRLRISQSARFYRYRWRGEPPIPAREIARSSANMHLVPSDAATAAALQRVRAGDDVRIDGWLIEARAADGWRWRSSLTRDDTGAGACELVYVCAIELR
ncbi:hypothetical protein H0E84_09890 [Luteimonas sp. SJ-92]|uniref:Uncharacterized protein n=1 Tax=Luteimonas salinisoli TaxID=2752307 RepID=A0A853JDL5_9GAMM|nr:hypothetical protein [Luteimonas salinisoli]NZA26697.1 hypothetical protein [Luteimonas salinisoli]